MLLKIHNEECRAISCLGFGGTAVPCSAKLTGATTRISETGREGGREGGTGEEAARETHVSITNANYCATRRRVMHLHDYGG